MTVKVTLIFNAASAVSNLQSTTRRIGGFTESWYFPGSSIPSAVAALTGLQIVPGAFFPVPGLAQARAGLLPLGSSITGYRASLLGGPSQSGVLNLAGISTQEADIPQMALLCKAPGLGFNNIRRFVLRAVPDQQVTEGEASFSPFFQVALNQFFLALGQWQFRGRDLSQVPIKVISITLGPVATVTTETPMAFLVGQMVRILKSRDSGGNLRGGRFQVLSVGPLNTQITVGGWGFGATTGGSVRLDTGPVFVPVDGPNTQFSRVVTRKVGRPPGQYRGRRSRRR